MSLTIEHNIFWYIMQSSGHPKAQSPALTWILLRHSNNVDILKTSDACAGVATCAASMYS
jgi:hypothetical protein